MKFYFAPMEGVTGYVYRNAHAAFLIMSINTLPLLLLQINMVSYHQEN